MALAEMERPSQVLLVQALLHAAVMPCAPATRGTFTAVTDLPETPCLPPPRGRAQIEITAVIHQLPGRAG